MRTFLFVFLSVLLIPSIAFSGELPDWVYNSAVKDGDVWRFSGSVHDVSLLNVAMPLARSAALSNLAQSIGVNVNAAVGHGYSGSEADGYYETVDVKHGYILNNVAAYGVVQKETYVERVDDPYSGRTKFNVHVLLEVSDADLQRAKADFSKRSYVAPKPAIRPKDEGPIKSFIRKIVF